MGLEAWWSGLRAVANLISEVTDKGRVYRIRDGKGSSAADTVVVMGVRFQNPTQMPLAQDNHMIDALAPDRSDQPFGKAILPTRGWRGRPFPDPHGHKSAWENAPI